MRLRMLEKKNLQSVVQAAKEPSERGLNEARLHDAPPVHV